MFDADRPITSAAEDRLNRALFAQYLARCMLDHSDLQSLSIGLYGGSGVGKTSLINMVIEELNIAASNMLDEEKPIILNFSPWSYSGQNQMIYSFFRRLSSTIRSVEYLENSDRIIHLLELYVSFFTHQPIPKPFQSKRTFFEKIMFKKRDEQFGWESGRDLTLVKAELNELLRLQKHKIIIIIDNISRLYDYEIKQIFQIVKSMGDYSNTTYLLALDKEQVINALNKLDGEKDGKALIEKVVQLPFEIPPILQQDIENIFADRLSHVLTKVPEESWNTEYWSDIYYGSLRYLFQNCRDVTRYVNTLNFSYARVRDLVNPIDYFALTAIEVFMPSIYTAIRENKDLFTDLLDNVYALNQEESEEEKIRCEEILARTNKLSRETLLHLLMHLFPRIRRIYQPHIRFYHSDIIARKWRRICNPDLFDVYFRLSMQQGLITTAELNTILALLSHPEAFDQALMRLNQDNRITNFLDQIDSNVLDNIPLHQSAALISALLDDGDLFPYGNVGPLALDTPMRIHRIIHTLLGRIESTDDRFILMQKAIADSTKSIYVIVHELQEQKREHTEEEDTFIPVEFRDLTPEQLKSLCKLAVSRIEWWATSDRLVEHPRLLNILFAWNEWGSSENCRKFVALMTSTDRGLIAFLTATLDTAIAEAMTNYAKSPVWENCLHNIEQFIPVHDLEAHAKLLFEDDYFEKLREREQLALMIFLDLINARTNKVIPKTSA